MIPLVHGVEGVPMFEHLGAELWVHVEPVGDTVVSLVLRFPSLVADLVEKLRMVRLLAASMTKSPSSCETLGKFFDCVLQVPCGVCLLGWVLVLIPL